MEAFSQTGQFILSISILIVLHELGHFIPAKLFKTRVEKFYLFFDPWFSLFKYKKGDTEYGIGWLPLGGYVKISGMIDESMDKEQMKLPAQPWEFRSKPAWQRLIIMIGGVTVNVILGFFIYSMILFHYGEKVLPNKSLTDGLWVTDSLALNLGFQNGDKIVSVNGVTPANFTDILPEMIYGGTTVVDRNGEKKLIEIPVNFAEQLTENESKMLFMPRVPFIIGDFIETSPNKESGLQKKDKVVAINEQPIKYFDEAQQALEANAGKTILILVDREGVQSTHTVSVNKDGKIEVGIILMSFDDMRKANLYEFDIKEYGFFESFPAGYTKTLEKINMYLRQFGLIFNSESGAYKGLGGFISIGGLFPAEFNGEVFWSMTAFLSLILAVMNILPIPALDGGHVLFLLYELITGRKPNEKVMEYAQIAGMVLLFSLLIFANGNDIFRHFF